MATMMSSCSQTKLGLEFTFHQALETLHQYIKQVSTAPNLTWHSSQTSPSPHRGSADSKSSNLNFVCWMDILQVCDLKRSCFVATGQLKMFSLALFIVPKIAPLLTWRHNCSLWQRWSTDQRSTQVTIAFGVCQQQGSIACAINVYNWLLRFTVICSH